MSKSKRMGPRDNATAQALLDAAERILRTEGYAAATSRRIAEEAGTTQQLVYYYYKTIDEVLLAAWQRRTERGLARLRDDAASGKPLEAIWADLSNATDSQLSFEYMALANHHDGIRRETAAFLEKARALQAEAIGREFHSKGVEAGEVTPAAAAFLIQAITLLLSREANLGVTAGHEDVRALVNWAMSRLS